MTDGLLFCNCSRSSLFRLSTNNLLFVCSKSNLSAKLSDSLRTSAALSIDSLLGLLVALFLSIDAFKDKSEELLLLDFLCFFRDGEPVDF